MRGRVSERLLDGKVAIVTGAGSPIGLGRAMALALVRAGARVAMLDVNEDQLSQSAAQALAGTGVTANVLVPGGPANTNLLPADSTRDRSKMLQADVMQAPVLWLASDASNDFTGKRIIAQRWDERLPLEERLAQASAPAAWPGLGRQA
jgi:NAD(P)-dependent dehydrogenase (short-subunit alcohol dehydrogenase family)